jgi:hypothetical protein
VKPPIPITRLNRQCMAWNEMRLRPFLDIKAGGVGISRKPGDHTDTLLRLPDPQLHKNVTLV